MFAQVFKIKLGSIPNGADPIGGVVFSIFWQRH